ncbi:MAG: Threonine-tRNA ligase [Parcubacteria group bacterium GW2011_GWC1_39_29]|nr:MAG: Threonine-tRNA ligase [Parcubacteria group bacterium GW2011_GWC1_39_29]
MKHPIEQIHHTLAHVMAAAVQQLYPDTKFGIGPIIDNGFYYDFDSSHKFTEADFMDIEKRMRQIIQDKIAVEHIYKPADEAIDENKASGQIYKVELLEEIKRGDRLAITDVDIEQQKDGNISFYKIGEFSDLCRGPHVENTGDLPKDGFKLTHVAGAYWRGNEKNKMMARIYAVAFESKDELEKYFSLLEEAKKRDHKKIGKDLGLFTFSPLVGAGLPLLLPNGERVKKELEDFIRSEKEKRGYSFVAIPHIAKTDLYVKSGHMGKYDAMMPVMTDEEGDTYVMKAMNCPHHFEIYNSQPHSYRDLPYRIAENTTVYRNEKSGELSGLTRVKAITQDDTHHFVRHDQIESEIEMILGLMTTVFNIFDFNNFRVQISVRDPNNKEKYFGDNELWDRSEGILIDAAKKWGKPYTVQDGEAAFYGPKIDIMVKDSIGREWQLTTVQLDFNQPENFDMTYIAQDGSKQRPAVLHVAILGSIERFMGILIEHYAGALPTWLSPIQASVIPISDKQKDFAQKIYDELIKAGTRTKLNDANETLGKRIRADEMQKIPYLLIVGDKEIEAEAVAVRQRGKGDLGQIAINKLISQLQEEIKDKK